MKTSGKQAGFTLVELVVAIAVSTILVGLLSRFMLMGFEAHRYVDRRKDMVREARLAVHFLNRDLRQVRNRNGVIEATNTVFRYWDYSNQQMEYRYSDGVIFRNGRKLATGIEDFTFRYFASDGHQMVTPVQADSLEFIWSISVDFRIRRGDHQQRLYVYVHPRNY
jgi:prepilin-type N-terminal cleavage/methylation domain-containing protein